MRKPMPREKSCLTAKKWQNQSLTHLSLTEIKYSSVQRSIVLSAPSKAQSTCWVTAHKRKWTRRDRVADASKSSDDLGVPRLLSPVRRVEPQRGNMSIIRSSFPGSQGDTSNPRSAYFLVREGVTIVMLPLLGKLISFNWTEFKITDKKPPHCKQLPPLLRPRVSRLHWLRRITWWTLNNSASLATEPDPFDSTGLRWDVALEAA